MNQALLWNLELTWRYPPGDSKLSRPGARTKVQAVIVLQNLDKFYCLLLTRARVLNTEAPAVTVNGMGKFSAADVLELGVQERLQLVQDIWNSIADVPEALELTEEDKRFIDERLAKRGINSGAGSPWHDVYARITSRRR